MQTRTTLTSADTPEEVENRCSISPLALYRRDSAGFSTLVDTAGVVGVLRGQREIPMNAAGRGCEYVDYVAPWSLRRWPRSNAFVCVPEIKRCYGGWIVRYSRVKEE